MPWVASQDSYWYLVKEGQSFKEEVKRKHCVNRVQVLGT
jgi:hypothetical protein